MRDPFLSKKMWSVKIYHINRNEFFKEGLLKMKKLLLDVAYGVVIVGLVGGGCYNILSVRPDIVAELPECIQTVYLLAENIIEEPELDIDEKGYEDILMSQQFVEEKEGVHMHKWKLGIISRWQSGGGAKGRVVLRVAHKCNCGEVLEE